MASISSLAINNRSMNGIIILTDGYAPNENGNIINDGNITTTNITTDDIYLNLGGGRIIFVFDDLNNKATYIDVLFLTGLKCTDNSSVKMLITILFT